MQRKVFRVEQLMVAKRPIAKSHAQPVERDDVAHVEAELALIRDMLVRHKRDLGDLIGLGNERHVTRATDELGAAIDGMEKATQKILKSVEVIDDSAKALTASIKDDYNRGLAQDIQDSVVRIYESCNFQDIAGQRIGKAISTLAAIEDQVSDMLARCNTLGAARTRSLAGTPNGRGLLNGPKLDGDAGHASQRDIDQMFN